MIITGRDTTPCESSSDQFSEAGVVERRPLCFELAISYLGVPGLSGRKAVGRGREGEGDIPKESLARQIFDDIGVLAVLLVRAVVLRSP